MKFEYKLKKDRILRKKITSKSLHNQWLIYYFLKH